jgi:hypothetical protein
MSGSWRAFGSEERRMTWIRGRLLVVLGVLALVVVSCGGGGDDAASTTGPTGETEAESGGTTSQQGSSEEVEGSAEEAPGERMAVISVDGEANTYDLDDLTFSSVEGVEDLTFETCSPDFFGSGRFYAIGYAVESDGEILVGDDGQPLGTFTMDLPPDDWEATQRDAPTFEIRVGELDIEIATPEEAAGGTMAWTIDDTTASGTAVFVDFDNTYTVEFDVVCEGSPTVNVDDLPADDGATAGDDDDGDGGPSLAGSTTGSFTADGETFGDVAVFSCEPFSFGSDPDPRDLNLRGFLGGMTGLEVDVSHSQGFDMSDGSQFDQTSLSVFYSRDGEAGVEQFEASAQSRADGSWFIYDAETFEEVDLADVPVVIDGNRITGALAGLEQTWPDEGAATVDVTFDYEIPSEVGDC